MTSNQCCVSHSFPSSFPFRSLHVYMRVMPKFCMYITLSCFPFQRRGTRGRVHNALNVCFAYHYQPLFSTHTLTLTNATFLFLHASNFHGVTFEMLPSCQDKSSTKAHKLVHNYMRASTASRLVCQQKKNKGKRGDQSAEQ